MKEDPFFLSYNKVPDNKRDSAFGVAVKIYEEGAKKIPGEYEKTDEELKAIRLCNLLIHNALKDIGLNTEHFVVEDRVHFLSQEIADLLNLEYDGAYDSKKDRILINKENLKDDKIELYKTILHEEIHCYSFLSKIAIYSKLDINTNRSGYVSKNLFDNDNSSHEHFRGFNEAIIENMVREIIYNNRDFLIKDFNLSEQELKEHNGHYSFSYPKERKVFDYIIEKMAVFYKKEPKEVWVQLKRGLLTGEMMHLRDIEEVFGPGSLRVLSAMGSRGSVKNIEKKEIYKKIEAFFKEENQEKRNILAKQILSERERLQYEKTSKSKKYREDVLE